MYDTGNVFKQEIIICMCMWKIIKNNHNEIITATSIKVSGYFHRTFNQHIELGSEDIK
jgi:hypothetical protein